MTIFHVVGLILSIFLCGAAVVLIVRDHLRTRNPNHHMEED